MLNKSTLITAHGSGYPRENCETPDTSDSLVVSLTNILTEWSGKDDRQQNQERPFNP